MISVFHFALSTLSGQARSSCLAAFDDAAGASERARVERLGREHDRLLYRLSHGLLRLVLAREAGCAPDELVFATSPAGKPICPGRPFFNMSHAADRVVIAISPNRDVGVDVEIVDAGSDVGLSASMAVAKEDRIVLPILAEARDQAETMLWSIKEAALKLTGEVMTDPGHMAVRRLRDGSFHVGPSRAATAPLHDVFVRQSWLDSSHVLSLATFEPRSASQIVAMPESWHGPPGPNISARANSSASQPFACPL
ncbi:4'-phosphopantetheinyl transferase family protein [Microvirga puerhi]|uniref:4'-phosphopantetheinyl transferase domain-containing protein n=1 Tax=Microvirga puerhi TaxID=2876078 RepID=A0ABS7VM56_9HYPH|nr:4'-phosphopantetheinyl transferase superfamily protein [Microvirga puerhi]MBZ6076637.1 hypothetical protein [Microvirga puerhi]